MTHTVHLQAQSTVIRFDPVETAEFSGNAFSITLELQCSGAVLLHLHTKGTFMSKYWRQVVRDGNMDERMYGGSATFTLMPYELEIIGGEVSALRRRGSWDAKYAPGAAFTGDEITPVNGLSDFHPQAQGYKTHRYDT